MGGTDRGQGIEVPETMQAVVLRGRGSVALETVPVAGPGPRQLLGRVDAAGICTSLIKTIDQGRDHPYFYGRDLGAHPAILGDEGSITVVGVGRDLDGQFEIGSRFVVQPAVDHPPITDREIYQDGGRGIEKIACGYTLPGLLAQYVLIPEEVLRAHCLVPVGDRDIPYAHAAIAEPLSCCLSGQEHHMHLLQGSLTARRVARNGLRQGGVTVIVGLGAMGRMHADIALGSGPAGIICSDPMGSRREKAMALFAGRADEAGIRFAAVTPEALQGTVEQVSGGRGADDLIIAVGVGAVVEQSLPLLARGGTASIFGGLKTGGETIAVDANAIHYRETCITGSSGGTAWDIARTVAMMMDAGIDAGAHIARIGGMVEALGFIDDVRCNRLEGKAVLYPHKDVPDALDVDGWSAEDEVRHLA